MANYWVKLYHEIIDDPKMATLPDRLWRRVIEIFLLAGRHYKDGNLPEVNELAWELRIPQDDLQMDMRQIESIGIIQKSPTGWLVVNYAKRQAASSGTERSHASRERAKREQYYNEDATQTQRSVAQIRTESDQNRTESADPFFTGIMTITGLTAGGDDLTTMTKWEKEGVELADIQAAMQWRETNGKGPVKTISQLAGSVNYARLDRVQGGNGKAASPRKPPSTPVVVEQGWHP